MEELPPGLALEVVEQALDRQLLHLRAENVFEPLAKFHPALRELVLVLKDHNWQVTERFAETVERIGQRMQADLDRMAPARMFYHRTAGWVQAGRTIVGGMLLAFLIAQSGSWFSVTQVRQSWSLGVLLGCGVVALLLIQTYRLVWLRRLILSASAVMVVGAMVWGNSTRVASSAVAIEPSSTPRLLASLTPVAPTVTATATAVLSPTSTVPPSMTPHPVVRKGTSPVRVRSGEPVRKKPRHYPPIWMTERIP